MATVEEEQHQNSLNGSALIGKTERRNTQQKNKAVEDALAPLIEQVCCLISIESGLV